MRVFNNFNAIKETLTSINEEEATIGFVPTMGALHEGHLSLIKTAYAENDYVIVSIFINPTQFNNREDFDAYPRTVDQDLKLLEQFDNNVLTFIPLVEDIYPNGIVSQHFDYGGIENQMEGKFRPGHFDGVGTVLTSFFTLLKPNNAYFGEKDFQQLQIVKKLVQIQKFDVNIIGCPILREASGLAMSSRNKRLSDSQLQESRLIFKVLKYVKEHFGTKNDNELLQEVQNAFKNNSELTLEYFEIADESTLRPLQKIENNKKYRAFIAAFAGEVRLIDNIALN
ncbi:MAG: pantoate--beta-alanine ligase [Flavobacteriaceae bacterium]|nr:pantoate--beta-alanine ligase [Flavobacteriaceae bacterium]